MADLFVLQGGLNPSTANIAMTASTSVRKSAGSPDLIFRLSPAMSPDAEILEAYDPCLGYDADNCPDQET
jgi:hypothetical protein